MSQEQLFQEYIKLTDIIHKYDDYFLRIKTWGVTVSGIAFGVGLNQGSWQVLLTCLVLAIGFWITEVHFKVLQLSHMHRATELEHILSDEKYFKQGPRIYAGLADGRISIKKGCNYRVIYLWPHVMFPHICFVVMGFIGLLYLIYKYIF